jgi:hypothetical protein
MKHVLILFGLAASFLWSATEAAAPPATPTGKKVSAHRAAGMPASARQFYATTWGVDELSAKLAESGQLVRFSYRVIDVAKAAPLNNRASGPEMIDEGAHVVLQVPTMEKVGPLRQSMTPQEGKVYWILFSNKGDFVKSGHQVSVVIGPATAVRPGNCDPGRSESDGPQLEFERNGHSSRYAGVRT